MSTVNRQLILNGDHYLVPLTKNARSGYAIIDINDYSTISKYNWYLNNHGYPVTSKVGSGGHKLLIHKLIMTDNREVDHINGDKLDNRRSNLRYVTHQQNIWNTPMPKRNTSGYKGVSWHKESSRFHAYIGYMGKRENIGYFLSLEEAVNARMTRESELYGEYARV